MNLPLLNTEGFMPESFIYNKEFTIIEQALDFDDDGETSDGFEIVHFFQAEDAYGMEIWNEVADDNKFQEEPSYSYRDVEVFDNQDVHAWWHVALKRARLAYGQATTLLHMQAIAAYLTEIDAMANEDRTGVKLDSSKVLGSARAKAWARIEEYEQANAKQMILDAMNGRKPIIVDAYSWKVAKEILEACC